MMMKKNKGVSMPEVLIALTVFMVMMIPLVSSLISGIKITGTAKETQNRDDYARNLMENIKEMPMSVLESGNTDYFVKMGSENVAITSGSVAAAASAYKVKKLSDPTNEVGVGYNNYQVTGTAYFGVDHQKYSYLIDVSNEYYAAAESSKASTGSGASDPNRYTGGYVESLDQSSVALISASMNNYDAAAYDVILSKKMADLRQQHDDKEQAKVALSGSYIKEIFDAKTEAEKFKLNTCNRQIRIKVSGDQTAGYEVKCILYYRDTCNLDSSQKYDIGTTKNMTDMIGNVTYVPYVKKFKRLPNIYLMYNVGVYNNHYMNDYIVCDLENLADEGKDVNVFIVETAEKFSDDISDSISTTTGISADLKKAKTNLSSGSGVLYRKATLARDAHTGIYLALRSQGMTSSKKKHFHVYHNLGEPDKNNYYANESDAYSGAVTKWNTHKKTTHLTFPGDIVKDIFAEKAQATGFVVSTVDDKCEAVGSVKMMDEGLEDIRYLYTVKVYMREGDKTAADLLGTEPVLVGTKGGGTIE